MGWIKVWRRKQLKGVELFSAEVHGIVSCPVIRFRPKFDIRLPNGQRQTRRMANSRISSISISKVKIEQIYRRNYNYLLVCFFLKAGVTTASPPPPLLCLFYFAFLWIPLLGQPHVTWYCWNSAGPLRWRVSESLPSRSKLSSERREASLSSWRAAGVHARLFDEWSHYIICLLYSRPPSTFLALSVDENNGPFVRLAKAMLLQCDPLKNCFWAEQFPLWQCGLFWAWECCLEAGNMPSSPKAL